MAYAPKATYQNPVTRPCFEMCSSCFRCDRRRSSSCPDFENCSGVPDKEGMRVPHRDHVCTCKEGVMRWVTKKDVLVIRRFESNPFNKTVTTDAKSEDERDWDAFISEKREAMNDEFYDPIRFNTGEGASDWAKKAAGL